MGSNGLRCSLNFFQHGICWKKLNLQEHVKLKDKKFINIFKDANLSNLEHFLHLIMNSVNLQTLGYDPHPADPSNKPYLVHVSDIGVVVGKMFYLGRQSPPWGDLRGLAWLHILI